MALQFAPLALSFALIFTPMSSHAQTGEEWQEGVCESGLSQVPALINLERLAVARQTHGSVNSASEWLGREFSFEDALAILERHTALVAPDRLAQVQSWIKNAFEEGQSVLLRELEVNSTAVFARIPLESKMKSTSFWNRFSFVPSVKQAKYVVSWHRKTIQDAYDLFEMEQRVLEFMTRKQYSTISGFNVFTRKPSRYLKKNAELIRDQLVLQWMLKGERGVEPTTLQVLKESIGLYKNLTIGMLWPMNRTARQLTPIHQWILDRYGQAGLAKYFYVKYGPATALAFGINYVYKSKALIQAALLSVYGGPFVEIRNYYKDAVKIEYATPQEKREAEKILESMRASPQEVVDQARTTVQYPGGEFKETNADPKQEVKDSMLVPKLSDSDRKDLIEMIDEVEQETKASAQRPDGE